MSSGLYQIRDKDLDTTLDLTRLKPYGDTMNDGKVQTSFTLPVKDDARGEEMASMPTVWASVPVEAPTITTLRPMFFWIYSLVRPPGQPRAGQGAGL